MTALPRHLPAPRVHRLRGGPVLRWGVLAPGRVAARFVEALHRHTDQRVVAVGSRTLERAREFAGKHRIDRAHGSYESLANDPTVEIVYVASPHALHRDHALLAIAAGKHVLIEKPLATTAAEGREIEAAARDAGVLAMEAMHTRFHPHVDVTAQLLDDGVLGDVHLLTASLGFSVLEDPSDRLYAPGLGGGVVLDLGVYALWLSNFVIARPRGVVARGLLASTGVESQAIIALEGTAERQAVVTLSLLAPLPGLACISGAAGRIEVDPPFTHPSSFTLYGADNRAQLRFVDESGLMGPDGLCRQAAASAEAVARGWSEVREHPLAASIAVLEVVDEVRRQVGAIGAPAIPDHAAESVRALND